MNRYQRDLWRLKQRAILHKAIANGEISRPEVCENCYQKKLLEAHHPDYNKPLEVIWLCHACHMNFHGIANALRMNQDARMNPAMYQDLKSRR